MLLTLALLLSSAPALADDTEPASTKARELKIEKGIFPRKDGNVGDPTKIASKAELEKAVPDAATAAAIANQVDFGKEFVLLFAWSGSGGDKLTMLTVKEAVFTR